MIDDGQGAALLRCMEASSAAGRFHAYWVHVAPRLDVGRLTLSARLELS